MCKEMRQHPYMAKSSRPAKTAKNKSTVRNSRTTVSGPAEPDASGAGDIVAEKAAGTQDLASAFPFNPNKAAEYDPDAALAPPEGASVKPADPIVGASTVTELNGSDKVGSGGPNIGQNPTVGPLDRVRVDSTDRALTTNQGVPVARQSELAEGGPARPDAARGLHPSREDHPLRSRAHSRADRPCARLGGARLLRMHEGDSRVHARLALRRSRQADAGLRPLLDRSRRTRLDRHRERRPWLRGEVLHGRRQLGSRRQQHPGLLHPGRDEVSRPRARGQARAALRHAAGGVGARHVLGLRVADARDHPHADVGDVRSRHPAQLSDDAGLRRAYLPPGQRQGRIALRQVPLEPEGRHPLAGVGRGRQDLRRRLRLPSPRFVGGDRGGRLPGMGAGAADLHRRTGRGLHLRRARRHEDRPRGAGADRPGRPAGAEPESRQLLRRNRAGGVLRGARRARRSTSRTIRCSPAAFIRTSTPRSRGWAVRTSTRSRSTRRSRRCTTTSATGCIVRRSIAAGSRTSRIRSAAAVRSRPARPASCRFRSLARKAITRSAGRPSASPITTRRRRLFWNSQTDVEKQHIINAFRFELSRVQTPAIRERMVSGLMNVAAELAEAVAAGLGIREMPAPMPKVLTRDVTPEVSVSPALSLFARPGDGSIRTRRVAILVADGCDGAVARGARRSADQRRRGAALRVDDARCGATGRPAMPSRSTSAWRRRRPCSTTRWCCPTATTRSAHFAPTDGRSNSSRTSTATASRSSRWAQASSCSRPAGSTRRCPTVSRIRD